RAEAIPLEMGSIEASLDAGAINLARSGYHHLAWPHHGHEMLLTHIAHVRGPLDLDDGRIAACPRDIFAPAHLHLAKDSLDLCSGSALKWHEEALHEFAARIGRQHTHRRKMSRCVGN